jgi:ribosomal protein S18 acetylase RimI-like enzyme
LITTEAIRVRGWHGEPYRHSLAARGIGSKLRREHFYEYDIYKRFNILHGGYKANRYIEEAIKKNPDLWDTRLQTFRIYDDADTIVALKGSSTGDIYPGIDSDNIIGFLRFQRRRVPGRSEMGYELSYIEVRKDYQGEGVGYAMLGSFFDDVVGCDNHVYVAYGSPEGQIFFEKFIDNPTIRNELWENDVTLSIEE